MFTNIKYVYLFYLSLINIKNKLRTKYNYKTRIKDFFWLYFIFMYEFPIPKINKLHLSQQLDRGVLENYF